MSEYLATGAIAQAPTPWGAREVLSEFLNELRATPFSWTGYTIVPKAVVTPVLQPGTTYVEGIGEQDHYVAWPKAKYLAVVSAWKTATTFLGNKESLPSLRIQDLIPRAAALVNALPMSGSATSTTPWLWILGGVAAFGVASYFAGKPARGWRAPKKRRKRGYARAVRRKRR